MTHSEPAAPVIISYPAEHIALVAINRPRERNAINRAVAHSLDAIVAETEANPEVFVVILTGVGGEAFSAGADLKEVAAGGLSDLFTPAGGFAGFTHAQRTKPWIAAVDGFALAGGCELVLACDLVVASHKSRFGLPEVKRGLIAAAAGLYRLPRVIPRLIATEIILTAQQLSAQRAATLGLVNRLVADGNAVAAATELAATIAVNAPLAVRESLAVIRAADDLDEDSLRRMSDAGQERLMQTEDFIEGPLAFIEKRNPNWKGR